MKKKCVNFLKWKCMVITRICSALKKSRADSSFRVFKRKPPSSTSFPHTLISSNEHNYDDQHHKQYHHNQILNLNLFRSNQITKLSSKIDFRRRRPLNDKTFLPTQ